MGDSSLARNIRWNIRRGGTRGRHHSGMFAHEEPPVIVAHCFGGFATILTGALYGEKLAGTVIVDSPVNPPDRPRPTASRNPAASRLHRVGRSPRAFPLRAEQPCENDYIVDFIARRSLKQVDGGWTWKFDPSIWTSGFRSATPPNACTPPSVASPSCAARCRSSCRPKLANTCSACGHAAPVIEIPQARHHVCWTSRSRSSPPSAPSSPTGTTPCRQGACRDAEGRRLNHQDHQDALPHLRHCG